MLTGIKVKSSDSNEQWKESTNFWGTSDKGNNDELIITYFLFNNFFSVYISFGYIT
jgi:hypothetical protein